MFQAPEMMSKPNFEVDIVKSSGRTLSFTCSYLHPDEQQGGEEQGPGEKPPGRIRIQNFLEVGSGSGENYFRSTTMVGSL